MEVMPTGIHYFKSITTTVPARTKEFPSPGLRTDLRSAGMNNHQIEALQKRMQEIATVDTEYFADLVTSGEKGRQLKNIKDLDHPTWIEQGLRYDQGAITDAVLRTVGEGWYVKGRLFLDTLVSDGRRIAVITGEGMIQDEEWFLTDNLGLRLPMQELISELESTVKYGAIIADVKRASKYPLHSPTQGIPFFYLADRILRVFKPGR